MKGTVIQVGDGRGFVIATKEARYVVTAAHCLPNLPPADPAASTQDRTYRDFLGPLSGRHDVWTECMFANPWPISQCSPARTVKSFPVEPTLTTI